MSVHFDDNLKFKILSELLRAESPSADIQSHGGPKIIVRNKGSVLIDQNELVGNYSKRIFFLIITTQVFIVGICCMILGKTMINICKNIIILYKLN